MEQELQPLSFEITAFATVFDDVLVGHLKFSEGFFPSISICELLLSLIGISCLRFLNGFTSQFSIQLCYTAEVAMSYKCFFGTTYCVILHNKKLFAGSYLKCSNIYSTCIAMSSSLLANDYHPPPPHA